jgi:hypothetical protein
LKISLNERQAPSIKQQIFSQQKKKEKEKEKDPRKIAKQSRSS